MKPVLNLITVTAAGVALLAGGVAQAQQAGSMMARIGVTQITPDVSSGNLSAPSFAGTQADILSNTQPSGGFTYMVTDSIAIDVPIAPQFKHNIVGTGAIAGVGKIGEVKALPVTVVAQYRFMEAKSAFRPYVGLGLTYASFSDEKSTAVLSALTGGTPARPTTLAVDSKFALSPQIGFTVAVNERWFVDASVTKSFLKTRTSLSTGQTLDAKLDPSAYAITIGYRY